MEDNARMTEARSQRGGVEPSFRRACAGALATSRRSRTSMVGCFGNRHPGVKTPGYCQTPLRDSGGQRTASIQGLPRPFKAIKAYPRVCRKKIVFCEDLPPSTFSFQPLPCYTWCNHQLWTGSLIIGYVRPSQPMSGEKLNFFLCAAC